jgi:hypothetical protein
MVDWRPPKLRRILFYLFFAPYFDGRKDATTSSSIVIALCAISSHYIPLIWPFLGWLLPFPIHWKPPKLMAPLTSLF